MNPRSIIANAAVDGVSLTLTPNGMVRVVGNRAAVAPWLPTIRERKSEIIQALREAENHSSQTKELRRLLESVAAANSAYWTAADVSEAFETGLKDLEAALQTWRAIAVGYGLADSHGKH